MNTSVVHASPAEPQALAELAAAHPKLPPSYLAFLGCSNGAEGPLGVEPGWFVVWPAEEALVASEQFELPKYLPGYFAFGGNGGGELLVFHLAESSKQGQVFMVPAIGIADAERQPVAASFAEFQRQIGKVAP